MPERPVVGRFYRVPCVYGDAYGLVSWWPIFGPEHKDRDLDITYSHWHFDARFLTEYQLLHLLRRLAELRLMAERLGKSDLRAKRKAFEIQPEAN